MSGKNLTRSLTWWGAVLLAVIALAGPVSGGTVTPGSSDKGPFVVLSGEFFQAMQKLAGSQAAYGDRQEPLLEQIAVSSQFIVKTNLTLIQQNEKIIRLLEELNRKRPAPER